MFGKAVLFLVMGFSLIFLVLGQNFGSITNRAVNNYSNYYEKSIAYDIAVSGANIAANQLYLDPTWSDSLNDVPYQGGKMCVGVQTIDAFKNIREITSVGYYENSSSIVQVTLQPSKFSKFAYYSVNENGVWWTNGDTVTGPFHTQDYIRSEGHPVFNGKVTTLKGIKYYYNKWWDSPVFNGGYEQGVSLPLPTTSTSGVETAAASGGYVFSSHDTVYLTFDADSIKYRFSYNGPDSTRLASTFAPNGVIFADNAVLRLQGVVKGKYTVGASGSYGMGNIYLDNNIIYNTNPQTDPSSTDLLGIVAQNNIYVTNNPANDNNIIIDAALFAQTGGFSAEDYNSRPVSGTIYLLGGITQNIRGPVGEFNSYGITSGFLKNYTYDNRLMYSYPPSFPNTGSYEIVSWYEWNNLKNSF